MPKTKQCFTTQEVAIVQKMSAQGQSRRSIASAIGIGVKNFEWHRRDKKFGNLPSRQGQNTYRKERRLPDSEETGRLFGLTASDWKATRDKIKASWDSEELARRSRSVMPNGERPCNLGWLHKDKK